MGRFRTNVTIVAICFLGAALMMELSGMNDVLGVSMWSAFMMIPLEIAAPILFVIGAIWVLDPA